MFHTTDVLNGISGKYVTCVCRYLNDTDLLLLTENKCMVTCEPRSLFYSLISNLLQPFETRDSALTLSVLLDNKQKVQMPVNVCFVVSVRHQEARRTYHPSFPLKTNRRYIGLYFSVCLFAFFLISPKP